MSPHIEELIQRYETTIDLLAPLLDGLTLEQTKHKPSEKEWSIREVMMHLADSEPNGALRIRKVIAEPGGTIVGYDPDVWSASLKYNDDATPFTDIIMIVRTVRRRTAHILKHLPESAFDDRTIVHTENGNMTLREVLAMYAEHVEIHARQIQRIRTQIGA